MPDTIRRPAQKIEDGLQEAIALVRMAKTIDPEAWEPPLHHKKTNRRLAAVHEAKRRLDLPEQT